METGRSFSPESAETGESLDREELFANSYVDIYHPRRQGIPMKEGIQITVDPKETSPLGEARTVWFSLAVAKAVAEGKFTEEFWANIQKNAHPGTETGINVWGRHPQSTEAWGKPVAIQRPEDREEQALDERQRDRLGREMELYLPKWERVGQNITLFEQGINPVDPQSQRFQEQRKKGVERPWPWQAFTAWMTDRYELTVVMQPHVKGVHLVLSPLHEHWSQLPREDFWTPEKSPIKAWETPRPSKKAFEYLQGVVESYVILMGVKAILEEEGIYFNGEIHFSGNWGFAPREAGPEARGRRVDESYLEESSQEALEIKRKKTKTEHERGDWMSSDSGWASHGHFYATDSPDAYVRLPSRPKSEKIEEWEGIPEMNEDQALRISQIIQEKLTPWLRERNLEGAKLF